MQAQSAGPRNRSANALANYYVNHQPQLRTPKVLEAIAHGQACFDVAYYLARNPDLAPLGSDKSLWRHYVYYGQFEPRMFR